MNNIEALRAAKVPLEDMQGLRISAYCPKTYAEVLSPRPSVRPSVPVPSGMEMKVLLSTLEVGIEGTSDLVTAATVTEVTEGTEVTEDTAVTEDADTEVTEDTEGTEIFDALEKGLGGVQLPRLHPNPKPDPNAEVGSDFSLLSKTSAADVEMLALAYKNTAAMDWMILNSLLSDKWVEFSLLGVSFSDTEVIKKSMGLISLVILGSTFLNGLTVA